MMLAEQAVAKKIQESYMQFVNEGNNPEQFNPEQASSILPLAATPASRQTHRA